jgi:hypothetical protein
LTVTINALRPGKRYTASILPSGAPIANAHTLAVRQLRIDLKTAKALGLTVPHTLLAAADELIE